MKPVAFIVALAGLALLPGCAEFPELDDSVPEALERAAYPRLVPVEPLIEGAREVQIEDDTEARIAARVAALRARAARLRARDVD
ncbi:hypothetical protein [Aquicoccus porphyridii]|uniref:hypothetical protein n=1 Tax=Aquicoccus porphyridii TaxID=1852029 RepID=UPI00273F013D|nr:hypothetical protein [Aquicoccus porphyridii]